MLRIVAADQGLPHFVGRVADAHPELIVVADDLIPRDGAVKPGGLIGFLIINGVGAEVSAGTGRNTLSVHDINKPSEFIKLIAVGHIAEHNAEIERRLTVQAIDGLDGGVEDMGRGDA